MDTADERFAIIEKLDAQRTVLRDALPEIASDIGMALRDAGLHFPVFISVRETGDSLATMATPIDPADDDWRKASDIVCHIIQVRLGCGPLRGRSLACAVANGTISAAEVSTSEPARADLSIFS